MGAKRFRWVRMDPYAKREARTSKKEPQISEKWTYCEAYTWLNLIGRWEQLVWCSQRAIPRDLGVAGGVWCEMDVNIQKRGKNTTKGARKNENEPAQIHADNQFASKYKQARNE